VGEVTRVDRRLDRWVEGVDGIAAWSRSTMGGRRSMNRNTAGASSVPREMGRRSVLTLRDDQG
jgi:hypothetical protein